MSTLTVDSVLDIFSDLLSKSRDIDVFRSEKLGVLVAEDGSHDHDRSDLGIIRLPDAKALAAHLLNFELGCAYGTVTGYRIESWCCGSQTRDRVLDDIRPRLSRLPDDLCRPVVEKFFSR